MNQRTCAKVSSCSKMDSEYDDSGKLEKEVELQTGTSVKSQRDMDLNGLSPEALRRLRRRISNRESARRLRKQRNEKLSSLMSQQDNLQGINEALLSQITSAKEELEILQKENQVMLVKLGESVSDPHEPDASRDHPSPHSSSEQLQPPSRGDSPPCPKVARIQQSEETVPMGTSPTKVAPSSLPARASPIIQQQISSITTRSSQRVQNCSTTMKIDLKTAIQELTNVKANSSAGSAAASAAAKAAAAVTNVYMPTAIKFQS